MNKFRMRDHHFGSFTLPCMHVYLGLLRWTTVRRSPFIKNVDNVVAGLVELRLRKIGQQAFVAAVAVDNQDLFAAVAPHLVGRFLQ